MEYASRGLRRRGDSDKWQVVLSHKDPLSGELVPSYHTIEAKTLKKAEKARDQLIIDLERKGSAYTSQITLKEFLDMFIQYKEDGMHVERSTVDHYRKQAKVVCRYLGSHRLAAVSIPLVNGWMAQMIAEGYAPRSVFELSLTTGMRRGEICALRWSDIGECEVTVSRAISLERGTDVRTVASYLGHSNVAMTLNTYAEVDPDAKRAAVDKIGEAFDVDLDGVFTEELEEPAFTKSFTAEQLRTMLCCG